MSGEVVLNGALAEAVRRTLGSVRLETLERAAGQLDQAQRKRTGIGTRFTDEYEAGVFFAVRHLRHEAAEIRRELDN